MDLSYTRVDRQINVTDLLPRQLERLYDHMQDVKQTVRRTWEANFYGSLSQLIATDYGPKLG